MNRDYKVRNEYSIGSRDSCDAEVEGIFRNTRRGSLREGVSRVRELEREQDIQWATLERALREWSVSYGVEMEVLWFQQIDELIERGEHNAALVFLTRLVNAEPKNLNYQRKLGYLQLNLKKYEEAENTLKVVIQLLLEQCESLKEAVELHSQAGVREEIQESVGELLRMEKRYAENKVLLGFALMKQNKLRQAEGHIGESIRVYSEDSVAYNGLGMILFYQGRYAEAELAFRQAAMRDLECLEYRLNIRESRKRTIDAAEPVSVFAELRGEEGGRDLELALPIIFSSLGVGIYYECD